MEKWLGLSGITADHCEVHGLERVQLHRRKQITGVVSLLSGFCVGTLCRASPLECSLEMALGTYFILTTHTMMKPAKPRSKLKHLGRVVFCIACTWIADMKELEQFLKRNPTTASDSDGPNHLFFLSGGRSAHQRTSNLKLLRDF